MASEKFLTLSRNTHKQVINHAVDTEMALIMLRVRWLNPDDEGVYLIGRYNGIRTSDFEMVSKADWIIADHTLAIF